MNSLPNERSIAAKQVAHPKFTPSDEPTRQKNVRQKNKRSHFSVFHFSVFHFSVFHFSVWSLVAKGVLTSN
jgi:hypothetical protein